METIHDHAQAISQSLGLRIHAMRESRDWTLEMLAERAGFSKAYLSRVEGGDRQPSLVATFGDCQSVRRVDRRSVRAAG